MEVIHFEVKVYAILFVHNAAGSTCGIIFGRSATYAELIFPMCITFDGTRSCRTFLQEPTNALTAPVSLNVI
jgi:hypothetical protein